MLRIQDFVSDNYILFGWKLSERGWQKSLHLALAKLLLETLEVHFSLCNDDDK